jgi:hypothetical protein
MSDVSPAITALAEKARSQHVGTWAVLAYGSALREATPDSTLVDLYVLTADFLGVSQNPLARLGCRWAAPNVHYLETMQDGKTYRAKYAVLPFHLFLEKCGRQTANPYFWARFSQPSAIIWTLDALARERVEAALRTASETAYAHAKALAPDASAIEQWSKLFAETYRTEFRPEQNTRARSIVEANAAHYENVARQFAQTAPQSANWAWARFAGKTLTILRLIKASFTFQGGPDYLAWKIKRHSGVEIELTDFQRRHPLLASVTLLPMLLRKGAVK